MKSLFTLVAVLMTFTISAQAEDAAVRAKVLKAVADNVAVASILDRSAAEVMLKKSQCQTQVNIKAQVDEFNKATVSGEIEIQQICNNTEMDGSTNTKISGTISSSRMLIDSVQISRSGF